MNQEKIGKFIAQCRKEKNLTQSQLAEKLNITNKTISKWETGRGMPDSSMLLELSKVLDINVNELLTGEKIEREDYQEKAEENIVSISKEKDKSKRKLKKALAFLSVVIMIYIIIIVGYFTKYFFIPLYNYNHNLYQDFIQDNVQFTVDNIVVDFKGLEYNKDKRKYKATFDFTTKNDIGLNSLSFDYIVYDENYNILSTSMYYFKPYYSIGHDVVNNFIIGFTYKNYHSIFRSDFIEHIIEMGFLKGNICDIGVVSNSIEWTGIEAVNSKTVTILLTNIKYQDLEGNIVSLGNKELIYR